GDEAETACADASPGSAAAAALSRALRGCSVLEVVVAAVAFTLASSHPLASPLPARLSSAKPNRQASCNRHTQLKKRHASVIATSQMPEKRHAEITNVRDAACANG